MNRPPCYQYRDKHVEMDSEPSADPVSIFNMACTEFRSSLSKEQLEIFQEYPNAKSMLTAVQSQAQNHPSQKSTLMRCCKGVSALAERLDPFFEIVSLFVSSHPEFAAIAWGSLRLVFMLGTNHAQFLKGVCELFQAMSLKLPIYEDFIRKWTSLHSGRQPPVRLITAMAYIYADLIQFCFDICQIFSRKRSGFLSIRGSFIHSLYKTSLNPFNVRYDVLLRRWDEHQRLVELEISTCTGMEQLETAEKIDRILKKFSEKEMFEDDRHATWRNVDFINHSLQAWINSPAWLTLFEIAQRQREMDSTEWFIDHELVSQWISHKENECASSQVLWVLGKPGFGKTTLCTALIETLQKRHHTANQQDGRVALTFFYFNKQRRDSVSNGAVWRAVLMQLFNIMPCFDPDVMDCFLLFRESSKASGQPVASDNEILAVLCLLVQRLDHLIFIVDGIDECEDQMQFWRCLDVIRGGSATVSVALFSRPSVMLPGTMKSSTATLHLDSALNLDDICLFLRPRIMSILDSGLLPQLYDLDEMVDQIAQRASGMFLWASLFVEYIQSPHLSTRERRHALQNLNRLQGLDLLYDAILKSLIQKGSSARSSTVQVFELVMHSIRPLHITELQHVIAIPLDRSLELDDLIPRFARNLGLLSGALMEIDQKGFVRFVHLSIIEYLGQAKGRSADGCDVLSEFMVDSHRSHVSLACRCLSYLYHTVTPEPLAGSSRITPDRESVVKKYPFLDYATEFWSFHALECMETVATLSEHPPDGTLVQLASSFLSSKPSVMAWIEASWVFGRPPVIRHGSRDAFLKDGPRLPLRLDAHLKAAWETAWKTLMQLSKSLDAINSSWAHVLKQEPNEIWEPSISAFNESLFWQRISGAKIVARFDAEADPSFTSIHLKTRISSDGGRLGLIRLHISQHEGACSAVLFELWSMEPNVKLNEINLRVPRSCLKPFLYSGDLGADALLHSFQCPVALTADLQRVVAPGCVVDIRLPESDSTDFCADNATQFIDFTGNAWRHGPFKFGLEDFQFKYDIQVSDTGRYLMTIHKSNGLVDVAPGTSCHLRLVTVYEDTSISTSPRASYRHVASLAFKPVYTNDMEGEWCALLHPKYPIVVIKFRSPIIDDTMKAQSTLGVYMEDGAGIWNFEASGKRRFRYIDSCPEKLVFDYDGQFFCNERLNDWDPNTLPDVYDGHQITEKLTGDDALGQIASPGKVLDSRLPYRTNKPPVQKSRELSCHVDKSGLRSVSQLESSEGGVVLATLREDGVMEAEMVARLPQSISGDHQAILLNLADDQSPSSRVLFLDREDRPFKTYSIAAVGETKPTEQLPMVLRRAHETIPKVMSEGKYAAEGFDLEHKTRKRLSWFTGEQVAKRRHTDSKTSETETGEHCEG